MTHVGYRSSEGGFGSGTGSDGDSSLGFIAGAAAVAAPWFGKGVPLNLCFSGCW